MTASGQGALAGSTAVVVGTGPAIGRACVRALAAAGAQVACVDHDGEAASASAAAAEELGVPALSLVADVLDRDSVRSCFQEVATRLGDPGILVNVVGTSLWSLSSDTDDAEWDRAIALNLRQQWVVAQEALHYMIEAKRGSIVAISSVSGLSAATRHGSYGAAKAGLINLVKTLAVENGQHQVRVNAIAPGTIDTPARSGDDALSVKVPLGRRGNPADIGNAAAFLSSPAANYITGQVLVVDGGVSCVHPLIDFA